MNDPMLRRIDGAVIAAALVTVPLVVLDVQGVALMLLGISLFAMQGASVAAYFIRCLLHRIRHGRPVGPLTNQAASIWYFRTCYGPIIQVKYIYFQYFKMTCGTYRV